MGVTQADLDVVMKRRAAILAGSCITVFHPEYFPCFKAIPEEEK
jgi:hypothetical protein